MNLERAKPHSLIKITERTVVYRVDANLWIKGFKSLGYNYNRVV
jgi:hypothetical protein